MGRSLDILFVRVSRVDVMCRQDYKNNRTGRRRRRKNILAGLKDNPLHKEKITTVLFTGI